MNKKIQITIPIKNPARRGQEALFYISTLFHAATKNDFPILEEREIDCETTEIDSANLRNLANAFIGECLGCFDELEEQNAEPERDSVENKEVLRKEWQESIKAYSPYISFKNFCQGRLQENSDIDSGNAE